MRDGASTTRGFESVANFNALDGLNPHERTGKPRVQSAIPVHVAAEPHGDSVCQYFDYTTYGVARLMSIGDLVIHCGTGRRVKTAKRILVNSVDITVSWQLGAIRNTDWSHCDGMRHRRNAEFAQERFGDCTECNASCSFSRRRAFENRSGFVEAVLLHSDEVGVARSGAGECCASPTFKNGRFYRVGTHHLLPLGPLRIANAKCHWSAHGETVSNPTADVQLILFEFHASATPEAKSAASQITLDLIAHYRHTRWQTLDNGNEFWAVGFPCSEPTKHALSLPTGQRAPIRPDRRPHSWQT